MPLGSSKLIVFAGPDFGFTLKNHFKQTFSLTEPDEIKFAVNEKYLDKSYKYTNENRTIVFYDESLKDKDCSTNYWLAVNVGLEYEFTFNDFSLSPDISFTFPFTNLSKQYDWYFYYFQAGINIYFEFPD